MKRFKFSAIIMVLAVFLFGGLTKANAASSIPDKFVTENYEIINYITYKTDKGTDGDYRVLLKKAKDGSYVYCIDLEKTYSGNITYAKDNVLDPGFVYILNHRPNTGDAKKDFYITQMAVYYYQDYLNNNNNNLQLEVKKYIIICAQNKDANVDASVKDVCKQILALEEGAKNYKEQKGVINIASNVVTFQIKDGYYVSSEIEVNTKNLNGNVKYSMDNVPKGTKIIKGSKDNTIVIKVPADAIPEGKQLEFKLNANGEYNAEKAYYYKADNAHQRLLYGKTTTVPATVSASLTLRIRNYKENYKVHISKTDVTQTKEIPGATLEVKDSKGNTVATWISTNETHELTLTPGEYVLTETIAPEGYKKSSTAIVFLIDADGVLYEKVNGKYYAVDKINMINELKNVVAIAKRDSKTNKNLAGAVLVIKDSNNNIVKEFTSTDSVYELTLDAGDYTLTEKSAPNGYVLSKEAVSFKVLEDGTLAVKNSNGDYQDSVLVIFYNTPASKQEVIVPSTGKSGLFITIAGVALLVAGVAYVKKTTKEY